MHDLALDYFQHVKNVHERYDHETDFFRLARALGVRIAPGSHNTVFEGPPPTITLQYGIYAARYGQRVGLHELAHHLLKDCGLEAEVLRLHGDWPGAEETIETLCRMATALLQLPDPHLREAQLLHGDSAQALLHLYDTSHATLGQVLRRWVHAEPEASRAAWTTAGPYISDVAAQGCYLPFWRHSRVPEIVQVIPEASLLSVGRGRVLGVVGG